MRHPRGNMEVMGDRTMEPNGSPMGISPGDRTSFDETASRF